MPQDLQAPAIDKTHNICPIRYEEMPWHYPQYLLHFIRSQQIREWEYIYAISRNSLSVVDTLAMLLGGADINEENKNTRKYYSKMVLMVANVSRTSISLIHEMKMNRHTKQVFDFQFTTHPPFHSIRLRHTALKFHITLRFSIYTFDHKNLCSNSSFPHNSYIPSEFE